MMQETGYTIQAIAARCGMPLKIAAKVDRADQEYYDELIRPMIDGKPTAYVCENFTCKQPVTDVAAFEELLKN